jgi:hypothetical protein
MQKSKCKSQDNINVHCWHVQVAHFETDERITSSISKCIINFPHQLHVTVINNITTISLHSRRIFSYVYVESDVQTTD